MIKVRLGLPCITRNLDLLTHVCFFHPALLHKILDYYPKSAPMSDALTRNPAPAIRGFRTTATLSYTDVSIIRGDLQTILWPYVAVFVAQLSLIYFNIINNH